MSYVAGGEIPHHLIRENREFSVDPAVANLQGCSTAMQETMASSGASPLSSAVGWLTGFAGTGLPTFPRQAITGCLLDAISGATSNGMCMVGLLVNGTLSE